MKLSKKDTTLNEKDALQDMLEAEKILMSYYSTAVIEGSSKPFRKEILMNYASSADTQMLARGYYNVKPAEKPMTDEKAKIFSKTLKEVKSG